MDLKEKIKYHLAVLIESGQLQNNDIVDICKHCLDYLNPQKVGEYAKENNISRQGVYKFREIVDFYGTKLVVDNE